MFHIISFELASENIRFDHHAGSYNRTEFERKNLCGVWGLGSVAERGDILVRHIRKLVFPSLIIWRTQITLENTLKFIRRVANLQSHGQTGLLSIVMQAECRGSLYVATDDINSPPLR
jgi:hypothetical protein